MRGRLIKALYLAYNKCANDINVQFSTKYYKEMKGSSLSFVPVDIPIEQAFAEYIKGRDRVLQAAPDYKSE